MRQAVRGSAIAAVAFVTAIGAAAPDSTPPVHVVRIDAIAVDARGRLVDTLKAADFELREDGAVKPIDTAEFTRVDSPRLFAIFLDEYHVTSGSTERVRDAFTQFIDARLRPRDLLVVMKPLDSLLSIRLSEDRDTARRAIASFEGRKGDYQPRNAYEQNYIAGTPARIEAARAQVTLSALNALAIHLGSLGDGRKTIIVVTEGVGRLERRRGQELLPTLDTVVRAANRGTVSIYAVDPRDGADDSGRESVEALASGTDGAIIEGDVAAGLGRVAADSGAYYLLTYRAPHVEDGAFHPVEIRAKRAGVRVRARSGYWAPSPDDALRTAMLERIKNPPPPPVAQPPRHISPLIRQWVGASRADAGKTRVTVVWEPAGRVPGDRRQRDPSRVALSAVASDGTVIFDGALAPTGPVVIEESGAAPSRAVFDTRPGRLRLQMSIEDAASQVLDSDIRDVVVPDLRRDLAFGTPEVLRARNAREFRLLEGADAVPVAAREFSRAERLLIRFPVYAPAGASPAISARLLTRMGQPMRDLPVAPPSATTALNTIDLPLASLAAGEYIVELSASTSAADAKERVTFRVTF